MVYQVFTDFLTGKDKNHLQSHSKSRQRGNMTSFENSRGKNVRCVVLKIEKKKLEYDDTSGKWDELFPLR